METALEQFILSTGTLETAAIREFQQECGTSGIWRIEAVTVTEKDVALENLRMSMHGTSHRHIKPGTIYRLIRGNTTVMSNTPAEMADMWELLKYGTGHILINGLGLGIAEFELLKKPDVTKITVIEISQDVINLSGRLFKYEPRVEIIKADCFEYQPPKGVRYGFVWHDIFDNITSDNLEDMKRLHRKYASRCDRQASWCRVECERLKRRGNCW